MLPPNDTRVLACFERGHLTRDGRSMDHSMDSGGGANREAAAGGVRPLLPFGVVIALALLFVSLAYALTFSHMVHVSLMEQVFAVDPHPPRFAPHVHYHHPVEWFLLFAPATLGWLGTLGSGVYLARHWFGTR